MILDEDAAALHAAVLAAGLPRLETLAPQEARDLIADMRARTAVEPRPVAQVRDFHCGGGGGGTLPLRLYHPAQEGDSRPCLVFFHGGGWVLNGLDTHDALCRTLAAELDVAVLSVDYRLAPEHVFPAAVADAAIALRFVHEQAGTLAIDPARILIGGDSSGGNLAAVVALMARDGALPPVRAQLLLYPALDLSLAQASHSLEEEGLFVTGATMRWFRELYLAGHDPADWRASPLLVELLEGVAPCHIVTAGVDPLRDEGLAYAGRLAAAGVRLSHDHFPGQIHGFLTAGPGTPTARAALASIIVAMKEYVAR